MVITYTQKIKNILKVSILVIIFFISLSVAKAEVINNFNSTITVLSNASIKVQEKIIYDFEGKNKHGIFRTIPLLNSKKQIIKINKISVVDQNNLACPFTATISGGILSIKIGDQNVVISGIKEYNITYEVEGAIEYYDNYDEIYWNVTGNGWPVAIEKAEATILLPDDISPIQQACYYGVINSSLKCSIVSNIFYSPGKLSSGEGLTIAVGFQKGIVYEPTETEKKISFIKNNIILLLPIIVLIVMFLIWRKRGRDPKGLVTIMAEYEPPLNIKPTLIGSLIDEKVDGRDITAGLIYVARKGFVKINRIEKKWVLGNVDYEIELVKSNIEELEEAERSIIKLFFANLATGEKVQISSFKKDIRFKKNFKNVKDGVYQEMANREYYEKNPNKIKMFYFGIAVGFFLLSRILFIFLPENPINLFAFILASIIILLFGMQMSKKTKLGAETRSHILGFKLFLSMTEKDRLEFHNAPEKKPELFMEFLPYAIAMGVEKKWAKQFEGIYIPEPSWYHGNTGDAFVVASFTSQMSNLNSSFITTTGSGSSGGGFSGGGGGGGGGGSW